MQAALLLPQSVLMSNLSSKTNVMTLLRLHGQLSRTTFKHLILSKMADFLLRLRHGSETVFSVLERFLCLMSVPSVQ